ncbi:phosphotransacetylase [Candidatus Micrarchaeota archaeon]|nr:phosphotransacetylase [Candidatus Micrarchaeota archaeon]
MKMGVMEKLKKNAGGLNQRIIFPEGADERIISAAEKARKRKMIKPILVGDAVEIRENAKKLKINLKNFDVIDPKKSGRIGEYSKYYSRLSGTSEKTAMSIVQQPIFYSAVALRKGDADGMIGGLVYTSGDFIAVCKGVIGMEKGITVPSSFFIMDIPEYEGGEGGVLVYSDASVNPNPTAEELADIAVATGNSVKKLLKWKPRIAMLSFSTRGSADHPDVCKVVAALEIAKKKGRGIEIDGEFQADSALVLKTAKRKIKGKVGKVAGKANVLIFPDLDAGNISYKLTQILADADAYGPILQGFSKPLSDLSRGATVEDILGAIAVVSIIAGRRKK